MNGRKNDAGKKAMALFLALVIMGIVLILSVQRNPNTGNITLDPMILLLGILVATVLYLALTFKGFPGMYPLMVRFCVKCGRGIPFDAVICPFCRYDYEENLK